MRKNLPPELKALVRETLSLLGEEISKEFGVARFREIEKIRQEMTKLRTLDFSKNMTVLKKRRLSLKNLGAADRYQIAHSFSLMMELMNMCENAYRSYRLMGQDLNEKSDGAEEIIFVVTAHPTEARANTTIPLFKKIQSLLRLALQTQFADVIEELRVHIRLLLILPLAPSVAPSPEDEAEQLYRWILDPELLNTILDREGLRRRVSFRAWCGGDKDGHPGVDQEVMIHSLELSRRKIVNYLKITLSEAELLLQGASFFDRNLWKTFFEKVESLQHIRKGDAARCGAVQNELLAEVLRLKSQIHFELACLNRLEGLSQLYPKWLIPLELRESSDVLESIVKTGSAAKSTEAVVGMLRSLGEVSDVSSTRHYVQAFVISMVRDEHDLSYAVAIQQAVWGEIRLPVVPLFETRAALEDATTIVEKFLVQDEVYSKHTRERWRGRYEMMLGYSDSAKESGVLASRVLVTGAMRRLDEALTRLKMNPVFFHGSGGSVARGGGTVEEQMAAWSPAARRIYKVTVQGEMVPRTFASPEQFLRHIQTIDRSSSALTRRKKALPALDPALIKLAKANAEAYKATVDSPEFLARVERATVYPFLHALKIGSRPSKRHGLSKVTDLRAIPWVLCWTQARVLFPNWWGLPLAWKSLTVREQTRLKILATSDPLWATYLKQLGFTLAKVDFAPWFAQLDRLGATDPGLLEWKQEFSKNFDEVRKLLAGLVGSREMLWFRPWLKESIHLRHTMIYPLNLLQDIAVEESDEALLRLTVTGISSGMLTTG